MSPTRTTNILSLDRKAWQVGSVSEEIVNGKCERELSHYMGKKFFSVGRSVREERRHRTLRFS